jgi:uncharacterized protein (UPF0332 family)
MTDEQQALINKANESIAAAQLLADEGYPDFAASRAYYAMFYVAEAFLLADGLTFSKHSAVIAAFGQWFAKTGRVPQEFHRYVIEGQASRNVGDYDVGPGLSRDEADQQIRRARNFVELAMRVLI